MEQTTVWYKHEIPFLNNVTCNAKQGVLAMIHKEKKWMKVVVLKLFEQNSSNRFANHKRKEKYAKIKEQGKKRSNYRMCFVY
tara:strand:+ start:1148 stop:1393 length:246 start_codon:yes stop_codon:yes gene_type:complete